MARKDVSCGGTCREIWGGTSDPADIVITGVRRRQLNPTTREPIPGTEHALTPQQIERTWAPRARRIYANRPWELHDCTRDCFCDSVNVQTFNETRAIDLQWDELKRIGVTVAISNCPPDRILPDLRSGAVIPRDVDTRQPYPFNPAIETVEPVSVECCAGNIITLQVVHLFEYVIEGSARVDIYVEEGTCKPVREGRQIA